MNKLKHNKISKPDLFKINEEDVMFITNPGRMGDVDGSTLVVKKDNNFTIYRVDGLMYPSRNENKEDIITFDDLTNHFSKWYESWNHSKDNNYKGKYKYIYMGFGNGLSVDNSIYSEFEPYLNKLVEKELEKYQDDKESYRYSAIYTNWEIALNNMINDK